MLTIKNVSAGYSGVRVIEDISLNAGKGESIFIIGANGCGKTTLLKCISGILDYEGEICIDGKSIKSVPRRKLASKVAMLGQINQVFFPYTIEETVTMGRYSHKRSTFDTINNNDRTAVEDALEAVGLRGLKNKRLSELSGGQLQRVFLAQIFAQSPQILLLDEPTNHLDLKYQLDMLGIIDDWTTNRNSTVIGVLHDLNLVQTYAKRVILIDRGKIYAQGSPGKVLTRENLLASYGCDINSFMRCALERWSS